MNAAISGITHWLDQLILIYSVTIMVSYAGIWVVSGVALRRHKRKERNREYEKAVTSPFELAVSVIAPCYNEADSIVENIKALMHIHYNNYEVIIVNDGSSDKSLERAIEAYEMERVHFYDSQRIATKRVRGVYHSGNPAYHNLILVDKENGGKADALNAGINVSDNEHIVCIDVDSIIEPDALLKLARPFLEQSGRRVIATGGVVHLANSCLVENGRLVERRVPVKILPRIQVLEYARAFLMGRIAWSSMNGLMIVSGALGMFDKEILIHAGGYLTGTVGEDMELIVRMRRYMYEQKLPHQVSYIPDPLLWTEAPEDFRTLGRQRNRWMRGTMDTLFFHRRMFLNPAYGSLGMTGYPYWLVFEWMAPWVEVLGLVYFVVLMVLGSINWYFFLFLLGFIYVFAVTFSFFAILYQELTFPLYRKGSRIMKLFLSALVEPFFYHFMNVYWSLKGNISWFRGQKDWGAMKRTGFDSK
jgi:cellulose synthase/poly-beta-1,6-N-acetylglucosamine synthase-like glycosyltransferase